MRKVEFDIFPNDKGEVEIITIADVHYGNEMFDLTHFTNVMDYCYKHKNVYIILNGDLIENNIPSSKGGSVFEQSCSPQEQIGFIVEALKPLALEHRIISVCGGNHDSDRTMKQVGITPTDMIVSLLAQYDSELPNRYSEDSSGCYDFLTFRSGRTKGNRERTCVYTLFHQHGLGGGTTLGGQVNKAQKQQLMIPSQIHIISHFHNTQAIPIKYYELSLNSHDIKDYDGWDIVSNAFLKNGGGYAFKMDLLPASNSVPIIKLMPRRTKRDGKDILEKRVYVECKPASYFVEVE